MAKVIVKGNMILEEEISEHEDSPHLQVGGAFHPGKSSCKVTEPVTGVC